MWRYINTGCKFISFLFYPLMIFEAFSFHYKKRKLKFRIRAYPSQGSSIPSWGQWNPLAASRQSRQWPQMILTYWMSLLTNRTILSYRGSQWMTLTTHPSTYLLAVRASLEWPHGHSSHLFRKNPPKSGLEHPPVDSIPLLNSEDGFSAELL